jgi:hypothetical protein
MHSTTKLLSVALVAASTALALRAAPQGAESGGATFEVTVTNLTRGQNLSPVLVAVHDESVDLFEAGQPASPELAALAEDGDASQLVQLLGGLDGVADVQVGGGLVAPGASETLTIRVRGGAKRLSLASMLVSTNDAFAGLDALELTAMGTTAYAMAWDAGSEFDSESCQWIPGPPCGNGGQHDPTPAEGFVHLDAGIHGIGDLAPAELDWRGPAAKVSIRRVK